MLITTQRLTVETLSDSELRALADSYRASDPELCAAYSEMLAACLRNPAEAVFCSAWRISLSDSGKEVGFAGFKGFNGGCPEIGYGINEDCRGNGYATEAVEALCSWALSVPGVTAVEAEAECGNSASVRVLTKAGFVPTGKTGAEGPRFVLS